MGKSVWDGACADCATGWTWVAEQRGLSLWWSMFQNQTTELVTLDVCWTGLESSERSESIKSASGNATQQQMKSCSSEWASSLFGLVTSWWDENVQQTAWCLSTHQEARALFEPFLPCDDVQLRKVYLRLALKYHPDKHPKAAHGWEGYKGLEELLLHTFV